MPQLDVVTYVFGFPIVLVCFQVLYMFNRYSFLPSIFVYSLATDFAKETKQALRTWFNVAIMSCGVPAVFSGYFKHWFTSSLLFSKLNQEIRLHLEQTKLFFGYTTSLLVAYLPFLKK